MSLLANLKAYIILVLLMLCLTVGSSIIWYHKGYTKAEALGNAQLVELKAEAAAQTAIETARQLAANMEAKRMEALKLSELGDKMAGLEAELDRQVADELLDKDRNREAFSKDSALRIGKVK